MKRLCWYVVVIAVLGVGSVMAVEEAEYAVVLESQAFEVRRYEPHIIAETLVDGDFEGAGNRAFNRLFGYISGDNRTRQEIAMTAPVTQGAAGEKIAMTAPVGQQRTDGRWAVSFVMPASWSLETLPEPEDPAVTLREVPARYMAAVRYSGFWSEKGYQRNLEKLQSWMQEQGFREVGEPLWARYNAPFMPWFLRRNEILIPVEWPPASD